MLEGIINRPTDGLLEKGLELARVRHQVIANNLANVDTPGYKRKDVDFSSVFAAELVREAREAAAPQRSISLRLVTTQPGHLTTTAGRPGGSGAAGAGADGSGIVVVEDGSTTFRVDGNNVDVDSEMAKLAENTIYYQALAQQVDKRLRTMLTVIDEGRR